MLERCQVESERKPKVCMGNSMNKTLHFEPLPLSSYFYHPHVYTRIEREEKDTHDVMKEKQIH